MKTFTALSLLILLLAAPALGQGISRDSSGWTVVAETPGQTRKVYVSAAGNDAWDGLAPERVGTTTNGPKRTLSGGYGIMRDGSPDWLLLRRGDTWNECFPSWKKSGKDADEPMVIGAYGIATAGGHTDSDPRPLVVGTGCEKVLDFERGGGLSNVDDLVIQGVHIDGGTANSIGIWFHVAGDRVLIEDSRVSGGSGLAVVCNAGEPNIVSNLTIRRCVFDGNYSPSHNQGAYLGGHGGTLLVEENYFLSNGAPDIFSHQMYIDDRRVDDGGTVTVQNNVFIGPTAGASHAMQQRPAGTCLNNFVARCAIGIQFGSGGSAVSGDPIEPFRSLGGECGYNVVTAGADISAGTPRGWAYEFMGLGGTETTPARRTNFHHNLAIGPNSGGYRTAFFLEERGSGSGNHLVDLSDCLAYNWGGSGTGLLKFEGVSGRCSGFTMNRVQLVDTLGVTPLIESDYGPNATLVTQSASNTFWSTASASSWTTGGSGSAWKSAVGDTTTSLAAPTFPNASASVQGFLSGIGVSAGSNAAAIAALETACQNQRRYAWNANYTATKANDYFRQAFGFAPLGGPSNLAPVANAGVDQSSTDTDRSGANAVTLSGSASTDVDGTIAAYAWSEGSTSLGSGVSITPSLACGVHTITLTVTDNAGASASDTVVVTITPTTAAGVTATPGTLSLTFSSNAYPGSATPTYNWRWGNPGGSAGVYPNTRSVTTTATVATFATAGLVRYQQSVTIGGVQSAWTTEATATPNAAPAPQAPTANAGVDQDVTDSDLNGSQAVTLNGSASSDTDGTVTAWAWSGVVSGSGSSPTLTFPLGVHVESLVVTDNAALTSTPDTVQITVHPGTATTLAGVSGVGSVTISCAPMAAVTSYLWEWGTASGVYTSSRSTATASTTITGLSGSTPIWWAVTPSAGGASGVRVAAAVPVSPSLPVNSTPVADAGADQSPVDSDRDGEHDFTLVAAGTDADAGDSLDGFRWTVTGPNPGVYDGDELGQTYPGSVDITLNLGRHQASLMVRDAAGAWSPSDAATYTVTPATPTGMASTPSIGSVLLSWDAYTGADSYVLRWGPASGSYTTGSRVVNQVAGTPPSSTIVTSTPIHWTVSVVGGTGLSAVTGAACADQTATPTPAPTNASPVAVAGNNQSVTDADVSGSEVVSLNGSASYDTDGTIVSYSWIEGGSTIATGATASVSLAVGTHIIGLFVVDDDGAVSDESQIVVEVRSGNVGALPSPVTGVRLYQASGGRALRVEWTNQAGVTQYQVSWSRDQASWTTVNDAGSPYTTPTTLASNRLYYVRVRAVNALGAGAWSATAQGRPSRLPPRRRRTNRHRRIGASHAGV